MCYIYMDRYVYIRICHRHVKPSTLQKISQFGKALNVFSSYLHIHSLIHSAPIHLVSLQCLQIKFKLISIVYKCLPELISASLCSYIFCYPFIFYIPVTSFACTIILPPTWNLVFLSLLPGISFPALLGETGTHLFRVIYLDPPDLSDC